MIEIECIARKIGNSIGFIIPKEVVEKENIKENERIKIFITKTGKNPIKRTFGLLKEKDFDTDLLLDESDFELWGIKK
ncbi:MAG: AbrB/MazE/SpoVT family DNA-binding domain-containing protein [Candidatus Woesearchaeota archaeon]